MTNHPLLGLDMEYWPGGVGLPTKGALDSSRPTVKRRTATSPFWWPCSQVTASGPHRTGNPDFYVGFLDQVNALPSIRTAKPIIIDGLRLTSTEHVLGLDCGIGEAAAALAGLVMPTGHVIGVDVSDTMISEARQRTEEVSLDSIPRATRFKID